MGYNDNTFIDALLSQKGGNVRLKLMAEYDAETIMRTICAYLNNEGGWIVVGVEKGGAMTAIDTEKVLEDIQRNTTQKIKPLPLVYIHEEDYQDGKVVLVTVMKGGLPPYSYDSVYYIEQKEKIVRPDPDNVNLLLRKAMTTASSWEKSTCLDAEWEDLNPDLLEEVFENGIRKGRAYLHNNSPEKFLGNLGLIDTPFVKNGAMALFGLEVCRFLPQCRVRIQVMLKGVMADRYEDMMVMEGNLLELSKRVNEYFRNRLPMVGEFHQEEWDRKDYSEYPQEVLDEAVTNALIHRDMSDTSGEILIFIYKDRIEIINPGEMPENLVKKKYLVQPHISTLRNPQMAEVFYIDGKMEKTGRGLALIHDRMNELNRRLPEWEVVDGRTKLTIYRTPRALKINERVGKFVASKKSGDRFSKKDYLQFWNFEISDGTAKNDLQQMLDNDLCRKEGAGPATKYVILAKIDR